MGQIRAQGQAVRWQEQAQHRRQGQPLARRRGKQHALVAVGQLPAGHRMPPAIRPRSTVQAVRYLNLTGVRVQPTAAWSRSTPADLSQATKALHRDRNG
jgi:hypothetical protein